MQQTLAVHVADEELRDIFGATTLGRARSYVASGRIVELDVDDDADVVSGVVVGTAGRRYRTSVHVDLDSGEFDLEAYCTCPVGIDCKHAAALVLAVRRQATPVARVPGWERALGALVRHATEADGAVPLALQFDVDQARDGTTPRSVAPPPSAPRRVRLRPVVPGARGRWVRTGVSWQALRFGSGTAGPGTAGPGAYVAAQQAALRELLVAYDISGRSLYGGYSDTVYLDGFGPSLWRLLRQALDAGVELVTPAKSHGSVVLGQEAVSLSLDVTADPVRAGAVVSPRLRSGAQGTEGPDMDAERVEFLGMPPHGVAVHTPDGLRLARLDNAADPQMARLVSDGGAVHVPQGDVDRFVDDYYPKLRRSLDITSSDGSVSLPQIAPPRLGLTLTYHDGHRIGLEWSFEYSVGDTVHRFGVPATDDPRRDGVAERRLADAVPLPGDRLTHLMRNVAGAQRLVSPAMLTGMDSVAFLDEVLPRLRENPSIVVHERGERPEFRAAENAPQVRVSTTDTDDADWFDLHVRVQVDGEDVGFDELFTALARGDEQLLLPSGTWFDLDHAELRDLRRLIGEARSMLEVEDGQIRLTRYQTGFWEELCSLGVVEQQSQRWQQAVLGLSDIGSGQPIVGGAAGETTPLPAGLQATLRPYQDDGYRWLSFLWDAQLGGILADDMGLGKTVQTLAMLCRAKETGQLPAPVLVVAPTSVVRNWCHEAAQFAPGLEVVAVTETAARRGVALAEQVAGADVVVTSYALFRIDYDSHGALAWSGLVLDEAQMVKNHRSKVYQCARRLTAPFKLAITGTPLENNLMELWALLSIVAPGLFPSPQKFGEFYRKPIERGPDTALLDSLRRRIRPLMRRRAKEEVAADLPAKQEQVLEVDLAPRHRRIYDTHLQRERQKILGLIDDLDKHRFTVLKSLTLLRQLSLDPALVDTDGASAGIRSSKVDVLLEHLSELAAEGHRALVFSQFTGFLHRVRERLDAEGMAYCYLDGSTRDRERAIEEFRNGDAPVFLISLKAGGFGLNLTEADYCFILDPWWNPATEAQAVDRTHRIGQDKKVVVYRLVASNTIEEKVMALKEHKATLVNNVLSDDGSLSAPLTTADIRALLDH